VDRVELTIRSSYLPNWGIGEGLRELIQNAKDAETEFNAPMRFWHDEETGTLYIENQGSVIPRQALLLGFTTKEDREDLIGQFGEGLKLGILAIVRAGYPCTVRTGPELWEPEILPSKEFGENVLTFKISNGLESEKVVRYEIGRISKDLWEEVQKKFLFLQKDVKKIETAAGDILLNRQGQIYVKGILVQVADSTDKLVYGYNLLRVDTDRDRKMVSTYALGWETVSAWVNALWVVDDTLSAELIKIFYILAKSGMDDLAKLEYSVNQFKPMVSKEVLRLFQEEFGNNAIPVANQDEAKAISFLGRRGVITAPPLRHLVLHELGGTLEDVKRRILSEVIREYTWDDLRDHEKKYLVKIVSLVNRYSSVDISEIDICKFRSDSFKGQFLGDRIRLARSTLGNPIEGLCTLIHEVAHRKGHDGEHEHVLAMEQLWSSISDDFIAWD
jgi:hypothetical protein